MNILFDNSSLQVAVDTGDHPNPNAAPFKDLRLNSFISILNKIGTNNEYSEFNNPISPQELKEIDLLIIATRMPTLNIREPSEIIAIKNYYHNKGSILLMANHPFNNRIPDNDVASFLCVDLLQDFVSNSSSTIKIAPSLFNNHPITKDIHSDIVFNTSCRIDPKDHFPIVLIPNKDKPNAFAVASKENSKYGRFIVVADSGFIADDSTTYPGPGQFSKGSNNKFIEKVLLWLLRDL